MTNSTCSAPVIVAQGTFFLTGVVDSIFVSKIGKNELAASALGSAWCFVVSFFGLGLTFGMDTLVSQAYGAKNMRLVGTYFQVCLFVCTLMCIPICVVLWFTESIMVALHQEPLISHLTGQYVRYLIIGVWPLHLYFAIGRWLVNQSIILPPMAVGILAFLLNIPFNYFFIFGVGDFHGYGLEGAAIATSLSRIIMPLMLWIFVVIKKYYKETSSKIYPESFYWRNIVQYMKFAVPSMLMIVFEEIGIEGATFFVGGLQDTNALAAHAVGFYILLISWVVSFGWSIGLSVIVGNRLGSGSGEKAKAITVLACGAILCITFANSCIIFFGKSLIIKFWVNEDTDEEFIELSTEILSWVALAVLFDGVQTTLSGSVKGIGKQAIGSVLHFITFYVVALPLGYLFCYVLGYGVIGFWWGLCAGLGFASITLFILIYRVDWDLEAKKIQERVGLKENNPPNTDAIELEIVEKN